MNTPEASLIHRFSPLGKISQVGVAVVRQSLCDIFRKGGLPQCIKVDNGRPFGDPQRQGLPILAMWLVGLGINVIWNRPRTPQDNAKVERSQGTLSKWTEYEKAISRQHLQELLLREAHFYNYHFQDRRHQNTTKMQRHPCLEHSGRHFTDPKTDENRIAALVREGSWQRTVSKVGQVDLLGQSFSVGCAHRAQQVTVRLHPTELIWIVSDAKGNQIARSNEQIWQRWMDRIKGET